MPMIYVLRNSGGAVFSSGPQKRFKYVYNTDETPNYVWKYMCENTQRPPERVK